MAILHSIKLVKDAHIFMNYNQRADNIQTANHIFLDEREESCQLSYQIINITKLKLA